MAATRQDEIERKYDVDGTVVFPDLVDAVGGVTAAQSVEHELEAVYFDTVGFDLARRGVTLRRRTGGDDAGWHLKLPGGEDTRTEVRLPLDTDDDGDGGRVPAALLEPVRAVVRDRALVPVARVSTRRREHPLLGDDVVLAKVADDEVRAERLDGSAHTEHWREWEVELVEGPRSVLDDVERVLVGCGAAPAETRSKLARILGDAGSRTAAPGSATKRDTGQDKGPDKQAAAHLLLTLVADQTAQLMRQDAAVRADAPGSVHKLRIAARRMRSALTTYKTLLEPGVADPLRDELRWLGQALGQARDAQVLREHLDAVLEAEAPELVLGPVGRRVDDALKAAERAGRDEAGRALDSERYFRLLDALDGLVADLPLTSKAYVAARDLVPRLLARDDKKLRRAVRDVERSRDAGTRDLALHEARKKAKRLRYAAESAVPTFGKRAKSYAAKVKKVQEALGIHQDSVVARRALREFGVQAHLSGENGFTFGRLHALEQWRADQAEHDFGKAWSALPKQKVRRWIRH
jgi:CHAD domain-containing protein